MAAMTSASADDWEWTSPDMVLEKIKKLVRQVPDFPKKGILFQDIMPIFKKPQAVQAIVDLITAYIEVNFHEVDVIMALDARGFLFGPSIAMQLNKPFVPVRKQGKLPGKCLAVASVKEYGEDILEIQSDALEAGQNVVIVDDLLATGGTMDAACRLVDAANATVLGCLCLIELTDLKGCSKLKAPFHAFIKY